MNRQDRQLYKEQVAVRARITFLIPFAILVIPSSMNQHFGVKEKLLKNYADELQECDSTYESESCLRTDQWVGGIGPMYNATILPLALFVFICCTYGFLKESSTDRGVAIVNPGQIVVGGEVLKNGRQYAFDYIADILKMRNEDDRFLICICYKH
ncbi:unnamed protein product [Gongylonema pulchrum]|uniref:PHB domain-containing protein n=1 Tax=Gongylonema pulchrum TaxID=637853 RepID=A0A183EEK4_9BILA|nr:unnamed protein product [Gongylonema pulchrum]